jgi:hypothetical protein
MAHPAGLSLDRIVVIANVPYSRVSTEVERAKLRFVQIAEPVRIGNYAKVKEAYRPTLSFLEFFRRNHQRVLVCGEHCRIWSDVGSRFELIIYLPAFAIYVAESCKLSIDKPHHFFRSVFTSPWKGVKPQQSDSGGNSAGRGSSDILKRYIGGYRFICDKAVSAEDWNVTDHVGPLVDLKRLLLILESGVRGLRGTRSRLGSLFSGLSGLPLFFQLAAVDAQSEDSYNSKDSVDYKLGRLYPFELPRKLFGSFALLVASLNGIAGNLALRWSGWRCRYWPLRIRLGIRIACWIVAIFTVCHRAGILLATN